MLLVLFWSCVAYAAIVHTSRATGSPQSVLLATAELRSHSRSLQALEEHTTLVSFFKSHPSYGIQDPESELKLTGTVNVPHAEARSVQTYQQVFESIPVLGATLKVVTDQGQIAMVNGVTVPNLQIDTSPSIDSLTARGLAENYLATKLALPQGSLSASSPTLSIYNPDLANDLPGSNYLAYRIAIDSLGSNHLVFVDAHHGDVVGAHLFLHNAMAREVYNGTQASPFWKEGDAYPLNEARDTNAVDAAKATYDLFKILTKYDSYDNQGSPLVARFSESDCTVNWHSEGKYFQYCTSNLSYDTAVHEWAHGYTEHLDQLQYFAQSGALHESFSDIVAASVEILTKKTTLLRQVDADCNSDSQAAYPDSKVRWRVGDDYAYDDNGYKQNLAQFQDLWQPSCSLGPAKTTQIRCSAEDNGETHINSLIPSNVFAKATDAIGIDKFGLSKMLHIYMRAKMECQYATTTLAHHAFCVQLTCNNYAQVGTQLPILKEDGNGIAVLRTQAISLDDCAHLKEAIEAAELGNPNLCADKGLEVHFMYPSVLPLTGGPVAVHIGGPASTFLWIKITSDFEDYIDYIISDQDAPGYIVQYPFPPLSSIGNRIQPPVFDPWFSTDGTNWVQADQNISYLSAPLFLGIEPREETVLGGNIITVTGEGFIRAQGCTRESVLAFERDEEILNDCFIVKLNDMKVNPLGENDNMDSATYVSTSSTLYIRMPPADKLGLGANDTVNVSVSVNGGTDFFHSLHYYRYVHMARIKDLKIEECTNEVGNIDTFAPEFHPNVFAYECEVHNKGHRDVTDVTVLFNYTEEGQTHTSRLIHGFGDVSHVGMVTGVNLLEIVVWSKDEARHQTYRFELDRQDSVDARIAELIWVDNTSATCNITWDPDVPDYYCTVDYLVDALHFETNPVYFETTVDETIPRLHDVEGLQPTETTLILHAKAQAWNANNTEFDKTYKIFVTRLPNRNAKLGSLGVTRCDFGAFNPNKYDYSCQVSKQLCDKNVAISPINLVPHRNTDAAFGSLEFEFGGTIKKEPGNGNVAQYTLAPGDENGTCVEGFSGTIEIISKISGCPATVAELDQLKIDCANYNLTIEQHEECAYDWTCEPVTYTITMTVVPFHDDDLELHVVYAAVKVKRLDFPHQFIFVGEDVALTAQAGVDLTDAIGDQLDFKIAVDPSFQNVSRNENHEFNVYVDWDVGTIELDVEASDDPNNDIFNKVYTCQPNDLMSTFQDALAGPGNCSSNAPDHVDIRLGVEQSWGFRLQQVRLVDFSRTEFVWWFNFIHKERNTDLSLSLLEPVPQEKENCPDFVFDVNKTTYECAVSHEVEQLQFFALPTSPLGVLFVNDDKYTRRFFNTEPNLILFGELPVGQNKSFRIASKIKNDTGCDLDFNNSNNCAFLEDVEYEYTVVITRDYPDAATLNYLNHSDCVTFLPDFKKTLVSGYRCEVPYETTVFNASGLSYERTHHRGADKHEGASVSPPMALDVGQPAVAWVYVTAPNQKDSLNYSITVVRLEPDETRLNSIQVRVPDKFSESGGKTLDLIPAFDRSIVSYKVLLPQTVDEVEMTAVRVDPLSTIRIGPTTNLRIGPNEGEIVVTAQNHHDVRHYFVTLLRGNDEAHLHDLTVEGCNSLGFDPEKFYYDLSGSTSGCKIAQDQILPKTKDIDASFEVQNMTFSGRVVHTVVVTSSSGRRQLRYDIDSQKASGRRLIEGLRPEKVEVKNCSTQGRPYMPDIGVFACTLDYWVENVAFDVSNVTITSINMTAPGLSPIDYFSNPESLQRDLTVVFEICFDEYENCVTVYVTVPKNGNSYLSNLEVDACVLTPAFSKDITGYACNIHPLTNVTNVNFEIDSEYSYSDCCDWPTFIEPGSTKYAEVRVTAEDDSSTVYSINITRPLDDDSSLKFMNFDNVCLSAGEHHFSSELDGITPPFNKDDTTPRYACVISRDSEAMGPTFETNNSFATVTADKTREVDFGTTEASITITAPDGGSSRTFNFLIIKPSGTAHPTSSIVHLEIEGCNAYTPEVRSYTHSYKCQVANENREVELKAIATEKGAKFDWNGTNPRTLKLNTNQVTLKVTSQYNESDSTTYTIEVERDASDNAGLSSFGVICQNSDIESPPIAETAYNCSVLYQFKEMWIDLEPTSDDPEATVSLKTTSGENVNVETTSLKVGENKILVEVRSSSNNMILAYWLIVTRESANTDASLKSLSVPGCELSPPFQPSIYAYTCVVSTNVTNLAPDYQVNSTLAESAVLNKPTSLEFGYNVMTVNVTAEAFSNSSLYKIVVTRTFTEETAPSKLIEKAVIIKDLHFNNTVLGYDIPNGEDMNTFTAKLMSDLYFHLELKSNFTVVGISDVSTKADLVVDVGVFLTNGNTENPRVQAFISALDLYLKALDENSELSDKESSTIYSRSDPGAVIRTFVGPVPTEFDVQDIRFLDKENAVEYLGTNDGIRDYWSTEQVKGSTKNTMAPEVIGGIAAGSVCFVVIVVVIVWAVLRRLKNSDRTEKQGAIQLI